MEPSTGLCPLFCLVIYAGSDVVRSISDEKPAEAEEWENSPPCLAEHYRQLFGSELLPLCKGLSAFTHLYAIYS